MKLDQTKLLILKGAPCAAAPKVGSGEIPVGVNNP
jgi:hypothetical protein